ncbi:MAG: DUF4833 domain-containing protein [Ferruginibacter sp.]
MDVRKLLLIIFTLCNIHLAGFGQQKDFPVPAGNSKQLFYLQRTHNINTIVYELNYKNGVVDAEDPVHEFWIRYQERGQREELSFIQRKFAYGLKTRKIAENQYELNFVSYKKYKLYLRLGADKKFYIYTNINEKPAILTSIFIKMNGGSFWSPNVEYVEICGIEPNSHSVVKQRLKIG